MSVLGAIKTVVGLGLVLGPALAIVLFNLGVDVTTLLGV
jgi:hypothetical protein